MLEEGEIDEEENSEAAAAMRKKRMAQWAAATATVLMCRSDCMVAAATGMATTSVPMCRSNWTTVSRREHGWWCPGESMQDS
jgi:hypothetical protein